MHTFYKVCFIVSLLTVQATINEHDLSHEIRSNRKKRSIIFPKGTVIQLVYCYLMSAIGTEGIFTVGVTLGTNWDVPVDLERLFYDEKMNIKFNRRDRRSLYPRIEYVLNQLNIDGRSCIRSMLCKSKKKFDSLSYSQNSFIEEILHTIFLYPSPSVESFEPMDEYDSILNQCSNNPDTNNGC